MRKFYTLFAAVLMSTGMWAQSITVSIDTESNFQPTTISNGSFDDEPWMVFTFENETYYSCPHDRNLDTASDSKDNESGYAQNVVFNGVGGGWNTTERTLWRSSLFEITNSTDGKHNYQHNSSIPQTDKYVEMNNYHSCMLYQDLRTNSHDVIRWTLKHAVTTAGNEYQPIRVEIGAPNRDSNGNIVNASGWANSLDPQIVLSTKAIYRHDGVTDKDGKTSKIGFGSATDLQYLRLHNTDGDQRSGWWTAQGVYAIPEGQTVTRFGFISEAEKKNQGNLLDAITFSTLIGNLSAQQLVNHDVEVKGYWGETNPTKRFKVVIDGVVHDIDMSSVVGKNFRIIIPASIVGTATSVEAYHQDYQVAENTIAVTPVYSSTLQSGTDDASQWTISPAVAEAETTIDVTYSGLLRPATVATTPIASTWTMEYTGTIQSFTAPATGVYELQVWGAQGGTYSDYNAGGLGGYATCHANLTQGETIYIYVGGQGGTGTNAGAGTGGWNGGGTGGKSYSSYYPSAGGGGGATHISKVNNQVIGSGSGQCASLVGSNFIIVAGGGGGAGWAKTTPGVGGGTQASKGTKIVSSDNYSTYSTYYYYSTDRSYGANGGNSVQVSNCDAEGAGGGGGGYYGGNAYCANSNFPSGTTFQNAAGCGGGSAYNSSLATDYSATAGLRSGNGKAEIRLLSVTGAPSLTEATKVADNHWQYTVPNYNVEVQVEYYPAASVTTSGNVTTEYLDFASALAAWESNSTLKLLMDVTTNSTITVNSPKTLDLNGFGIKANGVRVMHVGAGGNLTIMDSNTDNLTHRFSISYPYSSNIVYAGLATLDEANGAIVIEGGYITGGNASSGTWSPYHQGGAGIRVDGGTVTLQGGTIIGNHAESGWGGGVMVTNGGTFTMTGGAICYNRAEWGSGVSMYGNNDLQSSNKHGTQFAMSAGSIHHNYANGGDAVHNVSRDYTVTYSMTGGSIHNNYAQGNYDRAGLHVDGTRFTCNISGNPVIIHNLNGSKERASTVGDAIMTITGDMDGANIGVWKSTTGAFTTGYSTYNNVHPSMYFHSEHSSYVVGLNASGEAYLHVPYTVTFSGNGNDGGTVPSDANTYAGRGLVTISSAVPTKIGHSFAGWLNSVDGITYAAGASFIITANTTLTAQWSVNQYTITFNSNGGSAVDPITQDYGTAITSLADPTRTYYAFAGWSPELPATMPAEDIELTAQWIGAGVTLSDADENLTTILTALNDDVARDITIGRTIYAGPYNTFCLPFSMTAEQIAASPLNGAILKDYNGADVTGTGAERDLNIHLTDLTQIEAGKPFLVKTETNIENPTFNGVTVTYTGDVNGLGQNIVADYVDFQGLLAPFDLAGTYQSSPDYLGVGMDGRLYWADATLSTAKMRAFRAFFHVKATSIPNSPVRRGMHAQFVEDAPQTPTGVEPVTGNPSPVTEKLLRNGILYILRDGKTYNAQGQELE
ncbi:MAG: InlB B-repeat-containing protein [Paludibacteraceae bacterium]|nr:InlB B-repeat-containing protein [Paludibacteraceae bacterium]